MRGNSGKIGRFAIVLGAILLIEGVWGLLSDVVLGAFSTNKLNAALHVALGIIGILAGLRGGARSYVLIVGALLLVVGVAFYLPVAGDLVISLLNVNTIVAMDNIVVGAVALSVALNAPMAATIEA